MSEKGAFLKITKQFLMFKNKHDLSKMILMLLLVLGVNQDIIKVYNHKLCNIRLEYLIH